jgi:hypothetical protein
MNNYEKIKQMTVEEMAKIANETYDDCIVRVFGGYETYSNCEVSRIWDCDDSCSKCFKQWLLQEVEE